jgi:hypothetical protein
MQTRIVLNNLNDIPSSYRYSASTYEHKNCLICESEAKVITDITFCSLSTFNNSPQIQKDIQDGMLFVIFIDYAFDFLNFEITKKRSFEQKLLINEFNNLINEGSFFNYEIKIDDNILKKESISGYHLTPKTELITGLAISDKIRVILLPYDEQLKTEFWESYKYLNSFQIKANIENLNLANISNNTKNILFNEDKDHIKCIEGMYYWANLTVNLFTQNNKFSDL